MNEDLKTFTVFWVDGKREVLQGYDVIDSLARSGHNDVSRMIWALEFIVNGDSQKYAWNAEKQEWIERDITYRVV